MRRIQHTFLGTAFLLVLAFAAGVFLVVAALVVFVALVALAALGAAGAFLVVALVAVLVAVFFAAGAFFVVALVVFVVFLASAGEPSFLVVFLAGAAGLAVAFASFTGPDGPMHRSVSGGKQGDWVLGTATRWNAGSKAQQRETTAP